MARKRPDGSLYHPLNRGERELNSAKAAEAWRDARAARVSPRRGTPNRSILTGPDANPRYHATKGWRFVRAEG